LVVDDNAAVRATVKQILFNSPSWEVCGESADGKEALQKVDQLAPDVVVIDLLMPVVDGYQAIPAIRRMAPKTKIVLLSMFKAADIAQHIGADAFVPKSSMGERLPAVLAELLGVAHPLPEVQF
jgi:DNA-binding NarL/FixJ family response regulator